MSKNTYSLVIKTKSQPVISLAGKQKIELHCFTFPKPLQWLNVSGA